MGCLRFEPLHDIHRPHQFHFRHRYLSGDVVCFRMPKHGTSNAVPIRMVYRRLLSQTLIVHMIRTRKLPFIQSCASWQVTGLTLLIMAIGILLPFTPFGSSIGLEALPLSYFPWLFGILLSYCILTQLIKNWYIHRFTKWL